jgi:hypothetical protein
MEMRLGLVLAFLAVTFALISIGLGVRIANELRARGLRANPLMVRWMIFRYLSEYRRVTLEETGRVGPLFDACSTTSALAAGFAIAAILTRAF